MDDEEDEDDEDLLEAGGDEEHAKGDDGDVPMEGAEATGDRRAPPWGQLGQSFPSFPISPKSQFSGDCGNSYPQAKHGRFHCFG